MDSGKGLAVHVETVELGSRPESPASLTSTPTTTPLRPTSIGNRAPSLFSERKVQLQTSSERKSEDGKSEFTRQRTSSTTKKEVLMPAWQFFSLLPWYTDNVPINDDQVAAHFASKRPVLGICLKRYTFTTKGKGVRLNTYIDIPLEIALPEFISDEDLEEKGPAFGSFKLSLQSVVCHRGTSLNSGHYIALARLRAADFELSTEARSRPGTASSEAPVDRWVRFDDLASERVSSVDIGEALRSESPYLLFYQIRPIEDNEEPREQPPPYFESTSSSAKSEHASPRASFETNTARPSTEANGHTHSDNVADTVTGRGDSHFSIQIPASRRHSIAFTETTEGSLNESVKSDQVLTEPYMPSEESKNVFSSLSRRGSKSKKGEKIGALSATGNQLSLTMSRLSKLGVSKDSSKEKLGSTDVVTELHSKHSTRHSLDLLRSNRHENVSTKDKLGLRSTSLMGHRHGKSSSKLKSPDRECSVM